MRALRRAPLEPGMPMPEVLVVAPPPIGVPKGPIAPKFLGADARCLGLAEAYARVAAEEQCRFFDAATVTSASLLDGVHLDADQHAVLGHELARVVDRLL